MDSVALNKDADMLTDPTALDRLADDLAAISAATLDQLNALAAQALLSSECKLAMIVEPKFAQRMQAAFGDAHDGRQGSVEEIVTWLAALPLDAKFALFDRGPKPALRSGAAPRWRGP